MSIIKNIEIDELMSILEEMQDEELAVKLLKEFNDASKEHGRLILNLDEKLDSLEWKIQCDQAQLKLDHIIKKIKSC